MVNSIYVDDRIKEYIVNVVWATRDPAAYKLKLEGMIRFGASPRATIYLTLAAKAQAFIAGRGYVTPQDVKSIGLDVLRHRIGVSYEAEAESVTSEMIVEKIFAGTAGSLDGSSGALFSLCYAAASSDGPADLISCRFLL